MRRLAALYRVAAAERVAAVPLRVREELLKAQTVLQDVAAVRAHGETAPVALELLQGGGVAPVQFPLAFFVALFRVRFVDVDVAALGARRARLAVLLVVTGFRIGGFLVVRVGFLRSRRWVFRICRGGKGWVRVFAFVFVPFEVYG